MDTLFEIDDRDVLQGWVEARGRRRRGGQQPGIDHGRLGGGRDDGDTCRFVRDVATR